MNLMMIVMGNWKIYGNDKVDKNNNKDNKNNDIINIDAINNSLWTQEKSDALYLYSQLIHNMNFSLNECNSKISYEKMKDIINSLMNKYGYFQETLYGMLAFFKYCAHNYPSDLLFVYRVFGQFMKYFYGGPYRTYVIQQMTSYLLNVKTDASDYYDLCNYVLYYFPFCQFENKENLEIKLIEHRDNSLLASIDDVLFSNQIIFAIKRCLSLYQNNNNINIKRACLKRLIKMYKNLKIDLLVQKYTNLLKKIG